MTTICFVISYLGAFLIGAIASICVLVVLALKAEKKKAAKLSIYGSDHMKCLGSIRFSTEQEALDVINRLEDMLASFEFVTVLDVFDLVGIDAPYKYTYSKYNWTDLDRATIEEINGEYTIRFPEPMRNNN